jgi:hypothetical protein
MDINVLECFLHEGHPPFSQQLIPIPGLRLPPGKSITFQLNNFYCSIQNVNSSLLPCPGSLSAAAAELATEDFFLSRSDAFLGAFFVTIVSLVSFLDGTVLSV